MLLIKSREGDTKLHRHLPLGTRPGRPRVGIVLDTDFQRDDDFLRMHQATIFLTGPHRYNNLVINKL